MDFQRFKPHLPWITLLVLIALVGVVDDTFLRPANLLSLAGDIVPLFIMALGLTFAIYIGGIDLSAQSMANLITVVASVYLASMGAWVALLCVIVGFGLGMISGYVTTRLLVPSFISTLAVGGVAFSLAQYLSGQRALNMDAMQRDAVFGWMIGKTGMIPNELFIAAGLLAITLFIERRTTLGRAPKAGGGGVGGVLNTAIGTLIVAVIRASMLYFDIQATQQQMVFGLVLIGAIALTIDRAKLRIVK